MMRFIPLVVLCCLCGCARYEFEVLEPPEFATRVGRSTETTADIRREPLDYHMRSYEGRLVMNIFNTTEEPIELLGDESYVVDPEGESHALSRAAVIAPDAYIKLILPPLRPYYPREPRLGFGIGIGVSHYDFHRHRHFHRYRGPRFRHFFDPDMLDPARTHFSINQPLSYFWDWDGEGTIRLRLVYQLENGETFNHEFVIRRVRV